MLESQLEGNPKTIVYSFDQIEKAAAMICKELVHKTVFFSGDMGAGKTTLIAAMVGLLKGTDTVSSPTFSIVNEYLCADGTSIFHFDLYRIQSQAELLEMGFSSYLSADALIFIEWPENLFDIEIPEVHQLFIHESAENQRTVNLYS